MALWIGILNTLMSWIHFLVSYNNNNNNDMTNSKFIILYIILCNGITNIRFTSCFTWAEVEVSTRSKWFAVDNNLYQNNGYYYINIIITIL